MTTTSTERRISGFDNVIAPGQLEKNRMRLRQVALVAEDLAPVRQALFGLLGLDGAFVDEGVGEFGLENIVMSIGSTFLEVVSPVQPGTTAGRLLERRGGDGGYMVIVQVDDFATEAARLQAAGIRKVWEIDTPKAKALHMHPRDVPGAITSMDQMTPPQAWYWAGPDWEKRAARHVSAITGVQIQCAAPLEVAEKWSLAYDRPIILRNGTPVLQFEEGEVRFVEDRDGRGTGLQALDMRATDMVAIAAAAKRLGLPRHNQSVTVCGTQFNFSVG
jgi:electron transfer flavoprotein alpha subunit